MARIAVVSAIPQEVHGLCTLIGVALPMPKRRWTDVIPMGDHQVKIGVSGVGAERMHALLESWSGEPPDAWISLGFSGGLIDTLPCGSIVSGYRVLDPQGREIPVRTPPTLINNDTLHWSAPFPLLTPEAKRTAAETYGASLVDLEMYQVALHALNQDRPFFWLRGISDGVADTIPFSPEECLNSHGIPSTSRAVAMLLKRPWLLGAFLSLARTTHTLTRQLAERLLEIMQVMK